MIEMGLAQYLLQNASLQEKVAGRIYPNVAPQSMQMPFVIYQRISTQWQTTNDGPVGLTAARIQITTWSDDYETVKIVDNRIRKALIGTRNNPVIFPVVWPGGPEYPQGMTVQGVFLEDGRDDFAPPIHGDERGLPNAILQAMVYFVEE